MGNDTDNKPPARTRWERVQQSAGETMDLRSPDALKAAMRNAPPPSRRAGRWAGHGMSQATLADLAGCHKSFIGRLATGQATTVTKVLAERIARVLGVDVTSLFSNGTPTTDRPTGNPDSRH